MVTHCFYNNVTPAVDLSVFRIEEIDSKPGRKSDNFSVDMNGSQEHAVINHALYRGQECCFLTVMQDFQLDGMRHGKIGKSHDSSPHWYNVELAQNIYINPFNIILYTLL